MTAIKKITYAIIIVILSITVYAFYAQLTSTQNEQQPQKHFVTIRKSKLSLSGTVIPSKQQKLITPEGTIQSINYENGSHVNSGDAILTSFVNKDEEIYQKKQDILNSQNELNSLSDTINQQSQSQKTSNIEKNQNTLTSKELTLNQTKYTQLKQDIDHNTAYLNDLINSQYTTLNSPYSGTLDITENIANKPSISIRSDDLKVSSKISEYDYDKLALNQPVFINSNRNDLNYRSTVDFISSKPSSNKNNNALYKFTVPVNSKFLNGQSVTVNISQPDLKIPKKALAGNFIYKKDGHNLTKVSVKIKDESTTYVLVTSNKLQSGDKILLDPEDYVNQ